MCTWVELVIAFAAGQCIGGGALDVAAQVTLFRGMFKKDANAGQLTVNNRNVKFNDMFSRECIGMPGARHSAQTTVD